RRHNTAGERLLLDGHFVLLDTVGKIVEIPVEVFRALQFQAVVLVESDPKVVAQRLVERDGIDRSPEWVQSLISSERQHAEAVCKSIDVPLRRLISPRDDEFAAAIRQAASL
ncbi:MAG: AAA family ATPase, partial [Aquimonas sp.]|nr:AAA family ATPase [Aquimonas sp.]